MQMTPEVVNSIGLLLDIVGVVLIWIFGLGKSLYVLNSEGKPIEVGLGNPKSRVLYVSLDRLGLLVLIIGFTLQIISNWIPPT
jgi:hypothetical protein